MLLSSISFSVLQYRIQRLPVVNNRDYWYAQQSNHTGTREKIRKKTFVSWTVVILNVFFCFSDSFKLLNGKSGEVGVQHISQGCKATEASIRSTIDPTSAAEGRSHGALLHTDSHRPPFVHSPLFRADLQLLDVNSNASWGQTQKHTHAHKCYHYDENVRIWRNN